MDINSLQHFSRGLEGLLNKYDQAKVNLDFLQLQKLEAMELQSQLSELFEHNIDRSGNICCNIKTEIKNIGQYTKGIQKHITDFKTKIDNHGLFDDTEQQRFLLILFVGILYGLYEYYVNELHADKDYEKSFQDWQNGKLQYMPCNKAKMNEGKLNLFNSVVTRTKQNLQSTLNKNSIYDCWVDSLVDDIGDDKNPCCIRWLQFRFNDEYGRNVFDNFKKCIKDALIDKNYAKYFGCPGVDSEATDLYLLVVYLIHTGYCIPSIAKLYIDYQKVFMPIRLLGIDKQIKQHEAEVAKWDKAVQHFVCTR